MLKINETPVRTSKIFGINNIKIEDMIIPNKIEEFDNMTITGATSYIEITDNVDNYDMTYGLGDTFKNQIMQESNKKIKLLITDKVEDVICLDFDFNEENTNLVENIQIIAKENSKANIVIKYKSDDESANYHNGFIKLISEKESNINIVVINMMNSSSNNFLSIDNEIEDNARSKFTTIDFGGERTIVNYYSNLIGKEADNTINTIYTGKDEQLFDYNYIAELRGEKSNINMEIQGALNDKAEKHFKGTIDFKKGAKKATGDENEFCMLLSKNARSKALPMLLCSEEDVDGNHSSAAGKVDEKALFYIMSRGFSYKEAMKLIIKTKFNNILENIGIESLKEEIIEEIDRRLD